MSCSCCKNELIDNNLTQTEYEKKLYYLQCKYQEKVKALTDNWKLGVFCPGETKELIIAKSLLNLLYCYRVETSTIPGSVNFIPPDLPQCYLDWQNSNGINLTEIYSLPPGSTVGDLFFIDNGTTYWILEGVEGFYSGNTAAPLPTYVIRLILEQGDPFVQTGLPGGNNYYIMVPICTGSMSSLQSTLEITQGITITTTGLPQEDLILIANHLEKILVC
jgi:hypothetical protein